MNYTFSEKVWIFVGLANFFSLFFYLFCNKLFFYSFFNFFLFCFFLIYNLLTLSEKYVIKNFFKKDDIIDYLNIQKKLKIKNNILLNKNFQYIHYRYFTIPNNPVVKESATRVFQMVVGSGIVGTIVGFGLDKYHKDKDRAQQQRQFEEKRIEDSFNRCKEQEYKHSISLAKLKDSQGIFNSNKNQIEIEKKKLEEATTCSNHWDEIAKKNNIKLSPSSFNIDDLFS